YQMDLPLAYSAKERGWYCTEPTYHFTGLEMTEGELLVLLLAERLAKAWRGTAVGRLVDQAFAKVLNSVTSVVSVDLNSLTEAYSFEMPVTSELNVETFKYLCQAISHRQAVQMTYFTQNRGEMTERRVDPLHLRNYLGDWYVIAFDHMRGKVRD